MTRRGDVTLQGDGRIVVVGPVLARYTAAGSPDPTFSGDGRVPDSAAGVAIQPDGMIVTAGATVSRYRPNGSPDPGFSGDGKAPSGFSLGTSAVAVQSDGKIVVAGTGGFAGASSLQVLRLNRDGSPDTGFSGDGRASASPYATNNAAGLAIQPDGKIVVAGSFGGMSSSRFGVVRFNADGSADRSFGAAATPRRTSGSASRPRTEPRESRSRPTAGSSWPVRPKGPPGGTASRSSATTVAAPSTGASRATAGCWSTSRSPAAQTTWPWSQAAGSSPAGPLPSSAARQPTSRSYDSTATAP